MRRVFVRAKSFPQRKINRLEIVQIASIYNTTILMYFFNEKKRSISYSQVNFCLQFRKVLCRGDSYVGGRKHAMEENYNHFFNNYWPRSLHFYILRNHSRHHHKQQYDDFFYKNSFYNNFSLVPSLPSKNKHLALALKNF